MTGAGSGTAAEAAAGAALGVAGRGDGDGGGVWAAASTGPAADRRRQRRTEKVMVLTAVFGEQGRWHARRSFRANRRGKGLGAMKRGAERLQDRELRAGSRPRDKARGVNCESTAAPAPVAAGEEGEAGADVHLAGANGRSTRAAGRIVAATPTARSRRVEKGIQRSRSRRAARHAARRGKRREVDRRRGRERQGSRRRREAARGRPARPRAAPASKPARPAATQSLLAGG